MRAAPFCVLLLLVATPAVAADSGSEDDPSLFVRTGIGIGRLRSRNSKAPSVGASVVDSFAHWGSSLELTVGAQYRRWTVGATILEQVVELDAKDWKATYPLTGDITITLFTVGPTVEWHRDRLEGRECRRPTCTPANPRGGPWLGGTLGLAQLSFGSTVDPFGVAAAAQGGWDFPTSADGRTSVGIGARLTYARLADDANGGSRQEVFSPMLLFTWARR